MIRSSSLRPVPPIVPLTLGLAAGLALSSGNAGAVEPSPIQPTPIQSQPNPTQPSPAAASAPAPDTPAAATAPATTATLSSVREVVLDLSERRISLVENGKVMNSWPVAIGDPSTPTPTGRYAVRTKVLNPQYQSTKSGKVNPTIGSEGPLGDRWLGFLESGPNQYGIHGTPNAWSWTVTSRAAVTNGCVRMLRDHVRKLFELVEVGTAVVVQP